MSTYHYYPDYDSEKGVLLVSLNHKISYLRGRIEKIFFAPLDEVFRLRQSNKLLWNLNISVCTLICEGISGLSSYCAGGNDGDRYKKYVETYMYPTNPERKQRASLLWHEVRCSLSHGFYIRSAWIETDKEKHFTAGLKGRVVLDLGSLYTEFRASASNFFTAVSSKKSPVATIFEKRFDKVFPELIKKTAPNKALQPTAHTLHRG